MNDRPVTNEDLAKQLCGVQDDVRALTRHLTGGHNPEKGLIVRFDRVERAIDPELPARVKALEEAEKRKVWWARTTLGAAIGALVMALWAKLAGHGG